MVGGDIYLVILPTTEISLVKFKLVYCYVKSTVFRILRASKLYVHKDNKETLQHRYIVTVLYTNIEADKLIVEIWRSREICLCGNNRYYNSSHPEENNGTQPLTGILDGHQYIT